MFNLLSMLSNGGKNCYEKNATFAKILPQNSLASWT